MVSHELRTPLNFIMGFASILEELHDLTDQQRFYVGKIGTGVLMIFTLGGLGIWTLIDFIVLLVGSFKDKEGRYLKSWT